MKLKIVLVIILTDLLSIFKCVSCNVAKVEEIKTKFEGETSAREKREANQYSNNVNPLQQMRGNLKQSSDKFNDESSKNIESDRVASNPIETHHDEPNQNSVELFNSFPNASRVVDGQPNFDFYPNPVQRGQQAIFSRPGGVSESFHNPSQPRFELLLSQMRPIIPGKFTTRQIVNRVETPFAPFLRNIITLSKDLKVKMKPEPGGKKDKMLLQIAQTAKLMLSKNDVKQKELTDLMALFNEYFTEPKIKVDGKGTQGNQGISKAPFCKLGEDCFGDVDHPKIAMEIKRLALNLASYLKSRMEEEMANPIQQDQSTHVKFKTDAVLTQVVANVAKLHRAVLRNWHHILMMIGNFAGTNVDESDDFSEKNSRVDSSSKFIVDDDNVVSEEKLTGNGNDDGKKYRKKRETDEESTNAKSYLKQVQNWIGEMEAMLTTNEMAKTYYDSYHDYPDILCGSTIKSDKSQFQQVSDESQLDERGSRCTISDFWFSDPFCKSVVTDPTFECYPSENWVLERGQYAYKIDKDGTWFFTLSISTTDDRTNVEKDRQHNFEKDRQVVVGQLARIPKHGKSSIEVLLRIDNFIEFPKVGEKERKIQMSVGGQFQKGDLILVRMLPPAHDLFITIYGIHEMEEHPFPAKVDKKT